jgi:hypothetical protein
MIALNLRLRDLNLFRTIDQLFPFMDPLQTQAEMTALNLRLRDLNLRLRTISPLSSLDQPETLSLILNLRLKLGICRPVHQYPWIAPAISMTNHCTWITLRFTKAPLPISPLEKFRQSEGVKHICHPLAKAIVMTDPCTWNPWFTKTPLPISPLEKFRQSEGVKHICQQIA